MINENNRIFTFGQIQGNAILLLERRILAGGGYRTKIINLKKDSVFKFSIDLSVGLMQEVEELNRDNYPLTKNIIQLYQINYFSCRSIGINQKISIINTIYFSNIFQIFLTTGY